MMGPLISLMIYIYHNNSKGTNSSSTVFNKLYDPQDYKNETSPEGR